MTTTQNVTVSAATTRKKKYSPAYYARKKYAGTITINWDKINC